MRRRFPPSYLPIFLLALAPLFGGGSCGGQRTLDPAGPYAAMTGEANVVDAADKLVHDLDTVIAEVTAGIDSLLAWAQRNQGYVMATPRVREVVDQARAEVDGVPQPAETLVRLHSLRDAFLAATVDEPSVRKEIALARTFLGTIRQLIYTSPSVPTPAAPSAP